MISYKLHKHQENNLIFYQWSLEVGIMTAQILQNRVNDTINYLYIS